MYKAKRNKKEKQKLQSCLKRQRLQAQEIDCCNVNHCQNTYSFTDCFQITYSMHREVYVNYYILLASQCA